jgi:hypothetical protein
VFSYDIPVRHPADFKIPDVAGPFGTQIQISDSDNDGGEKRTQAYYAGNPPHARHFQEPVQETA